MKRRRFLTRSAQGVAAASIVGTALSTPAIGQGLRRLKMVTTWPRDFPGRHRRQQAGRKHHPHECRAIRGQGLCRR